MYIKRLKLFSSNIDQLQEFYQSVLGIEIIGQKLGSFQCRIGESELIFEEKGNSTPYHFAFNIPCNKESEALQWLKERVDVLKYENRELVDFKDWNAKAMYFYDTDRNIVELIARKNLNNGSERKFGSETFLELSEIGIPVVDVKKTFGVLNATIQLQIYDGSFEKFCALGDEHGLFICINKNRKMWFPMDDLAHSSDFVADIVQNDKSYQVNFTNDLINVKAIAGGK